MRHELRVLVEQLCIGELVEGRLGVVAGPVGRAELVEGDDGRGGEPCHENCACIEASRSCVPAHLRAADGGGLLDEDVEEPEAAAVALLPGAIALRPGDDAVQQKVLPTVTR